MLKLIVKCEVIMQALMESLFDVVYLSTVTFLGFQMFLGSRQNKLFRLFGIMTILLGLGDSFHLIPRMISLWDKGPETYAFSLGLGKLITSVTMTVFYIILYHIWDLYYKVRNTKTITLVVYLLAIIRIVLLFFPQNDWFNLNASIEWGIYRNIPFAIMGLIILYLFYRESKEINDQVFKYMWFAILLSFGFYVPVVLWADLHPLVGMLMIPKTCAYVWIVWMGYKEFKR